MPWTLVQADGTAEEKVDIAAVKALLDGDQHFWLDIGHPEADELAKLSELLDLHPLVRDDLGDFSQRAKADDYPTHTFLVLFGATHDADSLVEVHVVVSEKWLVTVHTEGCPAFIDLRKRTMRGGPLRIDRDAHAACGRFAGRQLLPRARTTRRACRRAGAPRSAQRASRTSWPRC